MESRCILNRFIILCFIFIGIATPISAGYAGYLDLLPVSEFNKIETTPNPQLMQFDYDAANLAGLAAEEEYANENDVILPARHFVEQGDTFITMKRYKDAEDAYEVALSGDPRDVDAIMGLGMVKFFLGSYPFAANKFDEAIKLDARNVLAWTYKAVSQANTDNLDGAISSIEKATTYDSSNAMAWYYAAAIYAESGDMTKAKEAIEKAQSLQPENTYIKALFEEINSGNTVLESTVVQAIPDTETESGLSDEISDEASEELFLDISLATGVNGSNTIFSGTTNLPDGEDITITITRASDKEIVDSDTTKVTKGKPDNIWEYSTAVFEGPQQNYLVKITDRDGELSVEKLFKKLGTLNSDGSPLTGGTGTL